MSEIIFEVREDEAEGGFVASALGHDILTEADTLEDLRLMVREAVVCHFSSLEEDQRPKVIRLHQVRDEIFAV